MMDKIPESCRRGSHFPDWCDCAMIKQKEKYEALANVARDCADALAAKDPACDDCGGCSVCRVREILK